MTAPGPVPTVTGTVIASAAGIPITGAHVSVGAATVTTGADGRFVLTNLTPGPATLRGAATGFETFEVEITVPSAGTTRTIDIGLKRVEVLEFGDFALYVPATVKTFRGVLLALGGPDTKAFATGASFGAPVPEVETSLRELGQSFRALAATHGLAVLGTSRAGMANGPTSDEMLFGALREAAAKSGLPELANAPLLLYGMSGGGPEASGFAARQPNRVAGLFLKVPAGFDRPTSGFWVPAFVVLAELDAFVDNAALTRTFRAIRSGDALWALALEPGVPHHSLSPAQRELTIAWISDILTLRLGPTASSPLRQIEAPSGWLGEMVAGYVAFSWDFPGDHAFASWLPSLETARRWQKFAKHRALPGFSLRVEPTALTIAAGTVKFFDVAVGDETGNLIDLPLVTIASQNDGVAQVRTDAGCPMWCHTAGRVTGIAPGTTTITVEYGGLTATVSVTVVP